MKEFTIRANEAGQRLDKYLKKLLPDASGGFIYKMLRKKNIIHNGKKAAGNEILKVGDHIKLFFSDETFLKFSRNPAEVQKEYEDLKKLPMNGLKVIYEDADILIADKPSGMLSQKAKATDLSANEYLLGYLARSNALNLKDFMTFTPSVCNRLDLNTTGLLLMGKSLNGLQELSMALKEHKINKYYLAAVKGEVKDSLHLSGYLLKDERTNRVRIYETAQKDAVFIETAYRPLAYADCCTLLEVHLITGKTHQIRAHLASAGHPVIGDRKYGDEAVNLKYHKDLQVNHQLLHAYFLVFWDGRTFRTEIPEIFDRIFGKEKLQCLHGIPED